jgi:acyl carrier protein
MAHLSGARIKRGDRFNRSGPVAATGDEMPDALVTEVISLIAAARRRSPESISQESSLVDLGFDSLDTLTTIFDLESKFGISFPDEQVGSLRTVRDVVEAVRKLKGDPPDHA